MGRKLVVEAWEVWWRCNRSNVGCVISHEGRESGEGVRAKGVRRPVVVLLPLRNGMVEPEKSLLKEGRRSELDLTPAACMT